MDLCFVSDPLTSLDEILDHELFDLVGITVRNIDSVLFFNNETFLADIRQLVIAVKRWELPIVVGGSGFWRLPGSTLRYLGVDFGIIGPGERAIVKLVGDLERGNVNYQLLNGWKLGFDVDIVPERGVDIDYATYLANGGIIGFETQKGCPNRCSFCIEAGHLVHPRSIPHIIQELTLLQERGFRHFHLCDSEFNLNLINCKDFLQTLIAQQWELHWTAYLVPNCYDEELFRLFAESHIDLVTLSVCSDPGEQTRAGYSYADLRCIIEFCDQFGIPLAIDLLVGFPNETLTSIEKMVAFFRANRPRSVGVNFYFRLYPSTSLTKNILSDAKLQEKLTRDHKTSRCFYRSCIFRTV